MRDLEQAKAEVFRRSNARIKKRKTIRRSIIACCVPLVLCLGAWSVIILPAMMPAKAMDAAESAVLNNAGAPPECMQDIYYSATADSIVEGSSAQTDSILVQGSRYSISEQDAAALRKILSKLNYNPHKVCRCLPQFTLEISGVKYGIHLDEGYARCDKGQAPLTQEQLLAIREILSRNQIQIN